MRPSPIPPISRLLRAFTPLLALAALLGIACSGNPISMTVQAGGTFILPLTTGNSQLLGDNVAEPAFGGSFLEDTQHGQLVVWLLSEAATWRALPTRLTIASRMPVEAPLHKSESGYGRQLILIADVPADVPSGDYLVALRLHRPGEPMEMGGTQSFYGALTVLPASITFGDSNEFQADGQAASSAVQNPTGASIQESWGGGIGLSVPDPSFSVTVRGIKVGSEPFPKAAYSAVDLTFPSSKIAIADVVPRDPTWMTVWHESISANVIRVHSVIEPQQWMATTASFRVTYDYVGGATQIAQSELTPLLTDAHDASGAAMSPTLFSAWTGW